MHLVEAVGGQGCGQPEEEEGAVETREERETAGQQQGGPGNFHTPNRRNGSRVALGRWSLAGS